MTTADIDANERQNRFLLYFLEFSLMNISVDVFSSFFPSRDFRVDRAYVREEEVEAINLSSGDDLEYFLSLVPGGRIRWMESNLIFSYLK